ncbi:MAG TPA: energy-coupling factor transporter ATPase [Chloroflexi bacterium]|jgi:energy-coupling factor transporter ATPase|nr:energy-coupling factor transporter ATPase [Chloroflexota bacterium]
MSDAIVTVQHLGHTYLPGTPLESVALRDAHLTVARGEIAALIGTSGAGKSTLAHFTNGLLRPTEWGRVTILGQDLAAPELDPAALRRRVGLVFQYPHQQLFERYVGDDVAYGPRQLGLSGDALRERVRWAMEAVGLPFEAFRDRQTFSLSGGEMRRAALAGVLAMRPELLVLDEATTGLDPQGRREVHALLRRLRDEEGVTVLLISNDMDEVAEVAERVTVLHEGHTVLAGTAHDVFAQHAALAGAGLTLPTVGAIVRALAQEGITVPGRPITVCEAEEALWRTLHS